MHPETNLQRVIIPDVSEEIVLWGPEDAEVLTSTTVDDAVSEMLDDTDILPRKLKVCGFARDKIAIDREMTALQIVDQLLTGLEERYQYEEDMNRSATFMSDALTFVDAFTSKYVPFTCHVVVEKEIDVLEWVTNNAPEWLLDGVTFEPETPTTIVEVE